MAAYYQIGSKGNEVKTLQDQLRAAGYDPGISDGIYGKNTASAVTEYQKAKDLTVDGIAGVQTLGSLNTPIIPVQQPQQPQQAVQPVQPAAQQPAQPDPVYTNPYGEEQQKALDDYKQWASQPYVSQYAPQLEAKINEILSRQFNYDPATDAQAQLAIKEMTRNVLETMNSRGILNSTLSRDGVTQGVSDLLPKYQQLARQQFMDEGQMLMSQVDMLMGVDETQYGRYQDEGKRYADVLGVVMEMSDDDYRKWSDAYERRYVAGRDRINDEQTKIENERQKVRDAWERVDNMRYADNEAALMLGIDPGTLSREAKIAKDEAEQRMKEQRQSLSNQLAVINAQYEKEKKISQIRDADSPNERSFLTNAQIISMVKAKLAETVDTGDKDAKGKPIFRQKYTKAEFDWYLANLPITDEELGELMDAIDYDNLKFFKDPRGKFVKNADGVYVRQR